MDKGKLLPIEIIEIMAHIPLPSLLADINSSPWFSLMADETRDVSNGEQLVICLRWGSENYEVFEDIYDRSCSVRKYHS